MGVSCECVYLCAACEPIRLRWQRQCQPKAWRRRQLGEKTLWPPHRGRVCVKRGNVSALDATEKVKEDSTDTPDSQQISIADSGLTSCGGRGQRQCPPLPRRRSRQSPVAVAVAFHFARDFQKKLRSFCRPAASLHQSPISQQCSHSISLLHN